MYLLFIVKYFHSESFPKSKPAQKTRKHKSKLGRHLKTLMVHKFHSTRSFNCYQRIPWWSKPVSPVIILYLKRAIASFSSFVDSGHLWRWVSECRPSALLYILTLWLTQWGNAHVRVSSILFLTGRIKAENRMLKANILNFIVIVKNNMPSSGIKQSRESIS